MAVSGYRDLYSGDKRFILSMASDDLRDRKAFFASLANHLRRTYNLPNGSYALDDVDGRTWAFFEGVVNKSPIVFKLCLLTAGRYSYSYLLNGVSDSGEVSSPNEIYQVLP